LRKLTNFSVKEITMPTYERGVTTKTQTKQRIKTKSRDFYVEMEQAEKLLDRAAQLEYTLETATGVSSETQMVYAAHITALSAKAQAHAALAHLYYVTG
jgi:hypothetical protein